MCIVPLFVAKRGKVYLPKGEARVAGPFKHAEGKTFDIVQESHSKGNSSSPDIWDIYLPVTEGSQKQHQKRGQVSSSGK